MRSTLRVAMAQMTSTNRHEGNIAALGRIAAAAAAEGAELLALPEAAGMMNRDREDAAGRITDEAQDPFIAAACDLAARHGLWIQTGSTPIRGPEGGDARFLNHANLIDDQGRIRARYDKIHLFDVFLDGRPPTGESTRYQPGTQAVLVDTPWGPWGLSVCYDLRFPHLYRAYARAGASVLFVPSAFTVPTGRAHWEVLLRARAIENGAWVVAAAQVGHHDDGRDTWGHSLIVSPWGEVVADLGGSAPGLAVLDLDMAAVARARDQIPSLRNERDFTMTHSSEPPAAAGRDPGQRERTDPR